MNNIIEVRGLRKNYKTFTLNDVSFDVPSGYITGFIGPNGAGKTTTIKLILGIANLSGGNVKVFGQEGSIAQNEDIGVVMDAPMYAEEWTIADVEKAIAPFYKEWNSETFMRHIDRFKIEQNKKVKELSRGMKVKLQIAAALSHSAKLLILDEPTSGLDPVARDEICDLLRGFVEDENNSVLFSTHITPDLEKTADYICFIQNGSIVYSGAKDDLLEKYRRVTGGLDDLTAEQKNLIIGYSERGTGFEGMTEAVNIEKLPSTVLNEELSLDEIIIFVEKAKGLHSKTLRSPNGSRSETIRIKEAKIND